MSAIAIEVFRSLEGLERELSGGGGKKWEELS